MLVLSLVGGGQAVAADPGPYTKRALEVTEYTQKTFWNSGTGLYARSSKDRKPDFMWPNGVMFSALVGASRHEANIYRPVMLKFFTAMDTYWDSKAKVPGYEPAPTPGDGNDKYYDDNAWMVITFLEAHEVTRDPSFLARADETLKFVLSGWDKQNGGGIWWHERHKDGSMNTCVNAPAAVACQRLARFRAGESSRQLNDQSRQLVDWTVKELQAKDGLFYDRKFVATGKVDKGKLTYNSALMIRAILGLYRFTEKQEHLDEARRIAKASDWFVNNKTGAYRDHIKWSHLMIEADLELYRATKEDYLIQRAKKSTDYYYDSWKAKRPADMMSNASLARILWLFADTETEAGRVFWEAADRVAK